MDDANKLDAAVFDKLAAPIPSERVEQRKGKDGKTFKYIKAESVMDRLDEAAGPGNWDVEIVMADDHVLCRLSVHLPSGRTVRRDGIGGYPSGEGSFALSAEDRPKGGATDAFKRAGVLFGIFRDYAEEPAPNAAGGHRPSVPPVSAPEPRRPQPQGQRQQSQQGVPRSGKALYAWTRQQEQEREVALIKYINSWAKLQEYPSRMIDWDSEQVVLAYAEIQRKLAEVQPVAVGADRQPGEDDDAY